jgi:predicted Ser/Thr protein kinase
MTRTDIDAAAIEGIVANGDSIESAGNQGSIHVGTIGDRRVLVKAAYGNPLMAWLRRKMLRRELRAYERLQGIAGIPRCYGMFCNQFLAIEFIDAPTYRHSPPVEWERFFERFLAIITAIHERGVAHGDLMRKSNILVGEGEYPYLIDFGVATIHRPGFHPLNRLAHNFLWQHDYNAWLKHKYRREFENMTPEDARYYRPQVIDRLASVFKRTTRRLLGRGHRRAAR